METLIQVAGVTVFVIGLFLGRKIWLLIPFLGAVELSLRINYEPEKPWKIGSAPASCASAKGCAMLRAALIRRDRLFQYFLDIEPRLIRYPALDPDSFRAVVEAFCQTPASDDPTTR